MFGQVELAQVPVFLAQYCEIYISHSLGQAALARRKYSTPLEEINEIEGI
jgi:hypothetical protein